MRVLERGSAVAARPGERPYWQATSSPHGPSSPSQHSACAAADPRDRSLSRRSQLVASALGRVDLALPSNGSGALGPRCHQFARVPSKSYVACAPSQNGWFAERPQRQSPTSYGRSSSRPSGAVSLMSPSTMYGPSSPTVMVTSGISMDVSDRALRSRQARDQPSGRPTHKALALVVVKLSGALKLAITIIRGGRLTWIEAIVRPMQHRPHVPPNGGPR